MEEEAPADELQQELAPLNANLALALLRQGRTEGTQPYNARIVHQCLLPHASCSADMFNMQPKFVLLIAKLALALLRHSCTEAHTRNSWPCAS